jgi:hypothetical protein
MVEGESEVMRKAGYVCTWLDGSLKLDVVIEH